MSRKLALVIGNSEYQDPGLAQLKSPGLDAYDLAGALRSPEIGAFDEVATLINETEAGVRRAIARFFVNRKPDDLLLLYFSGHGVRDDQGQLHLAVKDTDRALLSATAIAAAFVTGQMDLSRSRRQVLILDCCNSGAFDRAAKSGGAGSSMGTATAFEGLGYGRVVLTASDSTQYAWEGDDIIGEAANSVFTRYLVQGLETGEADVDSDGLISLDEWYDYVYAHVVGETPKQTPGKWSYKQQGDLIIARNPRPRAPKPVELPQELRQALESPLAYVREGAARELGHLLTGSNAGLAQVAREALQKLAEDDSRRVSTAAREALQAEAEAQRAQDQERQARERLAAQRAEEERLAREAKRAEEERLARERAEAERIAKQRAEEERLARERAEQERLVREKAEQERIARDAERAEAERERLARDAQQAEREHVRAERESPEYEAAAPMIAPTVAAKPPEPIQTATQVRWFDKWIIRPWFPLTALCLGWGLAFFSGTVIFWLLYQNGQELSACRFGELLVLGLIGGPATWLSLRAATSRGSEIPPALIIGLWVAITLLGVWLYPFLQENGIGIDERVAWERAIFGALGGVGIGAVLYQRRLVTAERASVIAAGWAIGWSVAAWLGLGVYNYFGDDPGDGIKSIFTRLGLEHNFAVALVPWADAVMRGLTGALAGLISGWVMLKQLGRIPSAEMSAPARPAPVEQPITAYWIAWLIITIGWAVAWLVIPVIAYFTLRDATYGFGAPLASAACAVVTVLALRRLLAPLKWPAMVSLALGWGLAAIYAEILTTHVFRNLLGWEWALSDLAASLLAYAARGGMVACVLWGLRLRERRLPALGLALSFAGALYLTDLFMRQAVYSSGFYYSIHEAASSSLGDSATLLSDAIAGGIAGGVLGALCGAIVLGALYWARRQADTHINSHPSHLNEFFITAARPLVVVTLGWIIARVIEAGLFYFITKDGYPFYGRVLVVVFTWALSGVIGGLGLWRALSSGAAAPPGLHWKLAATWAVAWALGAAVHLFFIFSIDNFGWPLQVGATFALASFVVGVVGGNVTARLIGVRDSEPMRWTTLGWALAWMCAALASSYSATEQGWWFGGLVEGLTGGWLGGAVMLWHIRRDGSSGN